jgi:hypothetical protein
LIHFLQHSKRRKLFIIISRFRSKVNSCKRILSHVTKITSLKIIWKKVPKRKNFSQWEFPTKFKSVEKLTSIICVYFFSSSWIFQLKIIQIFFHHTIAHIHLRYYFIWANEAKTNFFFIVYSVLLLSHCFHATWCFILHLYLKLWWKCTDIVFICVLYREKALIPSYHSLLIRLPLNNIKV